MKMSISNQRGNVLLFAISGIAMIAAIAMGMFYMTSTSSLGQAGGSGMNRAYYLALAGKDYALAIWGSRSTNEFILSSTERFSIVVNPSDSNDVTSTGIVNKDTPFEAKKTIKVLPPSPARRHFLDTSENLSKWNTGAGAGEVGGHEIAPVSGDNALHVTSTQTGIFGYRPWSFLQLKTGACVDCAVDFSPAWKEAGYCLSHDLQVKIANILPPQPYYMAGLNFKVAGSGNSREFYGISYLRASQIDTCSPSCWSDNDNIPSELKPPAIWTSSVTIGSDKYSQPAIVLWKRYWDNVALEYKFTWLAYKLLTDADYVVDSSDYLKDWSNLQVRLNEAYPLDFADGETDYLLNGAIVVGATSGASARISGTPIMTSATGGDLTVTNISGTFLSEDLKVNGSKRATTSGALGSKTNFIRVYYGDVDSHGTQNDISTDSNRGGNPRIVTGSSNVIHWPVDNVSDWSAYYDYMTLVQWDGFQASASRLGGSGTTEANAIIGDSSLLTLNIGTIDYSGIALHATGDSATSTYFDDFAVQY